MKKIKLFLTLIMIIVSVSQTEGQLLKSFKAVDTKVSEERLNQAIRFDSTITAKVEENYVILTKVIDSLYKKYEPIEPLFKELKVLLDNVRFANSDEELRESLNKIGLGLSEIAKDEDIRLYRANQVAELANAYINLYAAMIAYLTKTYYELNDSPKGSTFYDKQLFSEEMESVVKYLNYMERPDKKYYYGISWSGRGNLEQNRWLLKTQGGDVLYPINYKPLITKKIHLDLISERNILGSYEEMVNSAELMEPGVFVPKTIVNPAEYKNQQEVYEYISVKAFVGIISSMKIISEIALYAEDLIQFYCLGMDDDRWDEKDISLAYVDAYYRNMMNAVLVYSYKYRSAHERIHFGRSYYSRQMDRDLVKNLEKFYTWFTVLIRVENLDQIRIKLKLKMLKLE